MSGDRLPPRDTAIREDPVAPYDGERRPNKETRVDETVSTVTNDFLFIFHKNYHFPNDVKMMVPRRCGVNLSQLSFRAMSVTVGLIALFRDRGATMTPEHLSRMQKWGKMRDLPSPLHVSEEDKMRILKVSDLDHLLFEVRHMSKYTEEEFLFKVGISFHAGRSDARMLKPTSRIPEPPAPTSKAAPKRPARGEDPQVSKKTRLEETATNTDKILPGSSPAKLHISEDVLSHNCIGHNKTSNLGEFKRKYDQKVKEIKLLEEELSEYRTELANTMHSISLQNRQVDRHQIDLEEAQATITRLLEDQKASEEKIASLEAKDKKSQVLIAEKEAALFSLEPSRVIEDFKKSIAFKTIIQDHVEKTRDHIYDIEVKGLEQQCTEDGFIRGFFKGVCLMQRKTGVSVDGVTPSQASNDFPLGFDGDEIESDLQKVMDLDVDDEIVDVE
ncbi:hypothetical protein MA16_Dca015304 [Dendrobium catenatum]|uniref:Uncharacterized protein n=1 Tax=Dendrobium catenatum TaxID=906689 RepID=A0A2I0X034_9ASPA|nr:hypothetical protein MA16_Dca015304 [Dendrobium catenatum]